MIEQRGIGVVVGVFSFLILGFLMYMLLGKHALYIYPLIATIFPILGAYKTEKHREFFVMFLITNWILFVILIIFVMYPWDLTPKHI